MKLHEALAVKTSVETQATKCRTELAGTFEKKRHLFEEKRITFQPFAEGQSQTVESQSDIQTTVPEELDWISDFIEKAIDVSYQIADANTTARADIILDEDNKPVVLAANVPATVLLELEKRVGELTTLVMAIPTLDPAKGFVRDTNRKPGIYQARTVNKTRTKKVTDVLVLLAPTKEHPGQAKEITKDVDVGSIQEQEWSGLINPIRKAELLDRCETLTRAITRARARANETEVNKTKKIGKSLLDYVFAE